MRPRSKPRAGLAHSFGVAASLLATGLVAGPAAAYDNFESGHVRPLALHSGRVYAVNTPDDRLSIFDVGDRGLTLRAEVPVGLEPVAVAVRVNSRGQTEAWVTNKLSDSVSVVVVDDLDPAQSHVVRTLLVGDEPQDIVFARTGGRPGDQRAFITTARRGQHLVEKDFATPALPQADLTTPGTPRGLVWVFACENLGTTLGGTPETTIELFSDKPRALAVTPDGNTVYAAAFHSGNQTTAINELAVGGKMPPAPPGSTPDAPDTGVIVKFDPPDRWEDESGTDWGHRVDFELPDFDVFVIDATRNPPDLAGGRAEVSGVGTILFNMAVHPGNGKVYVTNLESRNHVRFEDLLPDFPTAGVAGGVRGNIARSRITVIDGTSATPVHLNPHVDYDESPGPPSEIARSVAFPLQPSFDPSGGTLFVPFLGSGRVVAYDTADLEAGTVTGDAIPLGDGGGGPTGVVYDAARDRLYVMTRFRHRIFVVDDATNALTRSVLGRVPVGYSPEPPEISRGRRFLYDASRSGHGDQACASCHVFGDKDDLAWNLGAPFGSPLDNRNEVRLGPVDAAFHPLKGPMTTQSLRGLAGAGPMHWRGDRSGGNDPGGSSLDERAAFAKFNASFATLLGAESGLPAEDMRRFTDFILSVEYPPNPVRPLNDVPTPAQANGSSLFAVHPSDGGALTCRFCHALPLGTDGFMSFRGETQSFKTAHLRNLYDKIGMFFATGDQVRGFGFLHDGSVATLDDFLSAGVFSLSARQQRDLEQFLLAFPTGHSPIVGQQLTSTPDNESSAAVTKRLKLMVAQHAAGRCELVASGFVAGELRSYLYVGANRFQPDRDGDPPIDEDRLRTQPSTSPGGPGPVTFTCVPVGEGARMGQDRDLDGHWNGDERDLGSNPGDPCSPTDCGDGRSSEKEPDSGSCGLLGIEALPPLLWAAAARRRRAGAFLRSSPAGRLPIAPMMQCKLCNTRVSAGERACPNCGAEVRGGESYGRSRKRSRLAPFGSSSARDVDLEVDDVTVPGSSASSSGSRGSSASGSGPRAPLAASSPEGLRRLLAASPEALERGLRVYHDEQGHSVGAEYSTGVGEIDLLATDGQGDLVAVMIATGHKEEEELVPYVLQRMGWVRKHLVEPGQHVRGIVLVENAPASLNYAAAALSDTVSFKTWRIAIQFDDLDL
jgi:DNA-binding beta-propeller fold protein YncE